MRPLSVEHLQVWQRAHGLVLAVYRLTRAFPKDELFGLTSQLRRAAASVPANITEGYRKHHTADKLRFYNIAQASLDEATYHLLLAHDLEYGDTQALRSEAEEVAAMLAGYVGRIRENPGARSQESEARIQEPGARSQKPGGRLDSRQNGNQESAE